MEAKWSWWKRGGRNYKVRISGSRRGTQGYIPTYSRFSSLWYLSTSSVIRHILPQERKNSVIVRVRGRRRKEKEITKQQQQRKKKKKITKKNFVCRTLRMQELYRTGTHWVRSELDKSINYSLFILTFLASVRHPEKVQVNETGTNGQSSMKLASAKYICDGFCHDCMASMVNTVHFFLFLFFFLSFAF